MQELCDFSCKNSEWRQHFDKCNQLLKDSGLENKSKYSYAFNLPSKTNLPNEGLFVKLSGPLFRVINLLGINYYEIPKKEDYDDYAKEPTYQTPSRAAYYLMYLKELQNYAINHVTIPGTFLVPLDDNQPKNSYCDDNCFIIQEGIPQDCVVLRDNIEQLDDLSDISFTEFLHLIHAIGLWDIGANTLVNRKLHKMVYADLEQPANINPALFYHKDKWLYENQIKTGFSALYALCKSNNELQRKIQEFAREHVHFQYPDKQKELENELNLNE